MLNYDKFVDKVKSVIEQKLGENCDVRIDTCLKNNGIRLKGIIIRRNNEKIAPVIYLEDFYVRYNAGSPIDEICDRIIGLSDENAADFPFDASFYEVFGKVKDKIVYRLINLDENEELLKTVPHRAYFDMAVIYCCPVSSPEVFEGTITIKNEHMAMWGVTEEDLYAIACKNTPKLLDVYIADVAEIICKDHGISSNADESIMGQMYVITNKDRMYGASAILYPGVLKFLSDRLKNNLFLIPSSVHEFIAVPEKPEYTAECINSMIQDVNSAELGQDEVLGYHAYYYNRDEEMLKVA